MSGFDEPRFDGGFGYALVAGRGEGGAVGSGRSCGSGSVRYADGHELEARRGEYYAGADQWAPGEATPASYVRRGRGRCGVVWMDNPDGVPERGVDYQMMGSFGDGYGHGWGCGDAWGAGATPQDIELEPDIRLPRQRWRSADPIFAAKLFSAWGT